jgi:hypothetical protein
MRRVAAFVSPHGFGHAARTVAILEALARRGLELHCELFTTVPRWFFDDALRVPFGWHRLVCDVGMVQRSAISEDLPATVAALARFLEDLPGAARAGAARVRELGCELVMADISPLGLAVAAEAGLPSVLVESFTWEWIYAAYEQLEPRLAGLADRLAPWFSTASLRIQTEPVCRPVEGALSTAPVARRPRRAREAVRRELGIGPHRRAVLVTMGGSGWRPDSTDRLASWPGADCVLLGGGERMERRGRAVLLPHRSPIAVQDLIAAVDAVVGKLGYSTVAEAWQAGTRYAFVPRRPFPESPVLEAFVGHALPSVELSAAQFERQEWLAPVEKLLDRPAAPPLGASAGPRGDDQAAAAVAALLPG